MNHLLLFFASFIVAFVLTWYVRRIAIANEWVSAPCSDRHVHSQAIPRVGGVAIFIAFCLTVFTAAIVARFAGFRLGFSVHTCLGLLGPAALVFGIGLYDDFRGVNPFYKFLAQGAAAVWLFTEGFKISHLPLLFGSKDLPAPISLALTVFWIVLITNAFNLIDGVDGLAAGSALFSTMVMFVIGLLGGNYFVSITSAALVGSILGFLRFNFHPATIFLGDSGSLFIGFMLGALGLSSSQKSHTMIAVAIPVVSCGLPILETGMSVLRRFMNGKPLFSADREHIHHKLLELGWSQRKAAVLLYVVSAFFAGTSLLLLQGSGKTFGLMLVVIGTVVWVALQRLGYVEMFELQRVAQRTVEQKSIIGNNLAIRRAAEKLKRCHRLEQICSILEDAFETNEFDGYELTYPLSDSAKDVAPLSREGNTMFYRWAKSRNGKSSAAPFWSLSLQLPSAKTWKPGTFVLFRAYQRAALRIDINLFTSSFQFSLAEALDRAIENAEMPLRLQEDSGGIAATAS